MYHTATLSGMYDDCTKRRTYINLLYPVPVRSRTVNLLRPSERHTLCWIRPKTFLLPLSAFFTVFDIMPPLPRIVRPVCLGVFARVYLTDTPRHERTPSGTSNLRPYIIITMPIIVARSRCFVPFNYDSRYRSLSWPDSVTYSWRPPVFYGVFRPNRRITLRVRHFDYIVNGIVGFFFHRRSAHSNICIVGRLI